MFQMWTGHDWDLVGLAVIQILFPCCVSLSKFGLVLIN